jgi:hypothetical protein
MITFRFVGSFPGPVRVTVLPAPAIIEPPLIIDPVQFALLTVFPVPFKKIVSVRFEILTKARRASINNGSHKFMLVGRVPAQI